MTYGRQTTRLVTGNPRWREANTPAYFLVIIGALLSFLLAKPGAATPHEAALARLLSATTPDMQMEARESLVAIPEFPIAPVIAAAEHNDWHVRSSIAWCLGRIGTDDEALETLSTLSKDPNGRVRASVAESIGTRKIPSGEPILRALMHSQESYVREEVADALGNVGTMESFESLRSLLPDPDPWVRRRAAISLGENGGKQYKDDLGRMLHAEKSKTACFGIVDGLTAIGGASAIGDLIQRAETPAGISWQLRLRCARAAELLMSRHDHLAPSAETPRKSICAFPNGLELIGWESQVASATPGADFVTTMHIRYHGSESLRLATNVIYVSQRTQEQTFKSWHWVLGGSIVFNGDNNLLRWPEGAVLVDTWRATLPKDISPGNYDAMLTISDLSKKRTLIPQGRQPPVVKVGTLIVEESEKP